MAESVEEKDKHGKHNFHFENKLQIPIVLFNKTPHGFELEGEIAPNEKGEIDYQIFRSDEEDIYTTTIRIKFNQESLNKRKNRSAEFDFPNTWQVVHLSFEEITKDGAHLKIVTIYAILDMSDPHQQHIDPRLHHP